MKRKNEEYRTCEPGIFNGFLYEVNIYSRFESMIKSIKIFNLLAFLIAVAGFSSCSKDEPLEPPVKERLILIYAVAANSLETNLTLDKNELLRVASSLNLNNNKVLVYQVDYSNKCILQELRNDKGKGEFVTVREFPELPLSSSSERLSEVITYVTQTYDYPFKGLVLWSHATGWIPWFGGSTPDENNENASSDEKRKAFGQDKYNGTSYWMNIDDMAEAIPPGVFDFIWFDCCYMANIETIYQLKGKTDYVVGSVLEIAADGMPYNLTMRYLLQRESKLREAATEFFNYYNTNGVAVSVSITDMANIDALAEAAGNIFAQGTPPDANTLSGIQNYERDLSVKFYDMGQLLRSYTGIDESLRDSLAEAFALTVPLKLISDRDFGRRPIQTWEYSGLSMHNFIDNGSQNNNFYKMLEWFKATRN